MLERASFVGTFRGRQIGAGKKSVTVRLSYREPSRTLRHEEIDGPVQQLIESMKAGLGATLRT
jgi:phenylalanyl-tRNA synthetase beta chain